jgi:hypothetical protein
MITGGDILMMLFFPALGGVFVIYMFELYDEWRKIK